MFLGLKPQAESYSPFGTSPTLPYGTTSLTLVLHDVFDKRTTARLLNHYRLTDPVIDSKAYCGSRHTRRRPFCLPAPDQYSLLQRLTAVLFGAALLLLA